MDEAEEFIKNHMERLEDKIIEIEQYCRDEAEKNGEDLEQDTLPVKYMTSQERIDYHTLRSLYHFATAALLPRGKSKTEHEEDGGAHFFARCMEETEYDEKKQA